MSSDAERLARAGQVLAGDERRRSHNAVYAVYVAVIAAGAYGVPAAQALLRFVDPQWLASHLGGVRGALLGAALLAVALALAYRLGKVRGPVVPPLPYLDTIASSPLDRALVLRPWWRFGLLGALMGGLLVGLVVGAGLAIAALASAWVLVQAVGVGTAVGLLVAGSWLHGQVRSWPTGPRGVGVFLRQRRSLRALHLTGLRTQAASAVTIGGAVLAGDLRAARLDVGPATTRGRRWRLRATGRTSVMVARDWLGLRRTVGAGLAGLLLVAAGGYALVQSATPGTPSIIALGGLILAYLGIGAWSEGLRLQGDNAGTPPLLGLDPSAEAIAHLVVPGVGYLLTVALVGALALLLAHATLVGIGWAVLMVGLLLAARVMAAFRGLPPAGIFAPNAGVPAMVLWYAVPLLVPIVCGTAASAFLSAGGTTAAAAVLAVTTWLTAVYARRRTRVLFEQHRG
ncbi:MAG: hypothetical protein ACOYBY_04345 [Dermatophilaceae bacterium]